MWELHDGQGQVGPLDEAHVIRMLLHGIPDATVVRRVGEAEWRSPRSHAPFAVALQQKLASSASLALAAGPGYVVAPAPPVPPRQAKRLSKSSFIGVGCMVQGLGLVALFVVPAVLSVPLGVPLALLLGLVTLLAFVIVGRRMSTEWSCGACGNRISGGEVRLCQVCHAELS